MVKFVSELTCVKESFEGKFTLLNDLLSNDCDFIGVGDDFIGYRNTFLLLSRRKFRSFFQL